MTDLETQARAAGYSWDDIDEYMQGATGVALDAGYGQDDIDRYVGFDPAAVSRRADTAIGQLLPPVPSSGDPTLDLSQYDWRGQYANAMANGEVRGSFDWADSMAAAALDRMDISDPATREQSLGWAARAGEQMVAQLPSRREFTDAALDVSGARPDDPAYDEVRRNLIGHWQDTGEGPVDAAGRARVNTELADKLNARPQRGVLGELGAGIARGAGSFLFGIEHIANNVEGTVADLFDSDELRATAKRDIGELARREADWMKAYQRGEGIDAFVAGTIGEAIPTLAEYVVAGVPRMVAYGALHGASLGWERTGSATAAYTGALIHGAFAGAPAPFLHGAAGQGLMRAAVKGAVGMGAIGGLQSIVDPLVDFAGGKPYEFPDIETIGEAAAGGAIVGAMFGGFAGTRPKVRLIDPAPDMPDRAVGLDDAALKPTEAMHSVAADLAGKADQMERLRLENEGLTQGNATESENFFQRIAEDVGALTTPEPRRPGAIKDVLAQGSTPLYHDTSAQGLQGILQAGVIEPRVGRGRAEPSVFVTRDFDNYSKRADSPYRLILDDRSVGHKSNPVDVFGDRGEREQVFDKPVGTRSIRAIAVDTTNHALKADMESGRFAEIEAAAADRGIAVQKYRSEPLDPKKVYALAEGYRAANALHSVADSLFGPLWRDETGAMKLGGRANLSDAEVASMRERADVVDRAVRYNEAVKDRYNTDVKKDLHPMYRAIEPLMPEWTTALDSKDIDRIKSSKIGQFIAHMQGIDGFELPADHELTPFARVARKLFETSRAYSEAQIAAGNMSMRDWQKQYWPQQWADPTNAERIFGSPSWAKVIPNFFDGINAGLDPAIRHPLDLMFHNLTRASAQWTRASVVGHLAGNYARDAEGNVLIDSAGMPKGRDENAPVVFTREQPSGNMTPIFGLTRRGVWETEEFDPDSGKNYTVKNRGELQAYASPEIAKMIKNWHDRYSVPSANENFVAMINRASNAALAFKLIVPVFHLISTTGEMVAGGMGTLMRLTAGDLTVKDIGESIAKATALAKELHTKGLKLSQTAPADWNLDPLIQTALEGGFRHGKRQSVYLPGRAPDIIESLSRGSLGRELKEEYERDGFKMVPYETGRAALTVSAPLFDHVIPMMKTVSTLTQLELAMRSNPTMGSAELFKNARQIGDNSDHRLGEMNMNNLFWPRWVRATLGAALISPSWVYGTAAYTAAGLGWRIGPKGLRGWEWNPYATANLAGLAVASAGINGIAQWLWSGKLPGEDSPIKAFPQAVAMDLLYPRTGGVSKGWAPARMMIPSQMKEYYDWAKVVQETYAGYKVQGGGPGYALQKFMGAMFDYGDAKVRPMWNAVFALTQGEDAIGRDPALSPGGIGRFLADQFLPIALNQWESYRPKSGIGRVGAALGLRELPDWIEDPRRYWNTQQYLATKRTRDELRRWRREQGYMRP